MFPFYILILFHCKIVIWVWRLFVFILILNIRILSGFFSLYNSFWDFIYCYLNIFHSVLYVKLHPFVNVFYLNRLKCKHRIKRAIFLILFDTIITFICTYIHTVCTWKPIHMYFYLKIDMMCTYICKYILVCMRSTYYTQFFD